MHDSSVLFSERPTRNGLANIAELVNHCPFKNEDINKNVWCKLANELHFNNTSIALNWRFKSEARHADYLRRINAIVFDCRLDYIDRIKVCGWLLSEILDGIPRIRNTKVA